MVMLKWCKKCENQKHKGRIKEKADNENDQSTFANRDIGLCVIPERQAWGWPWCHLLWQFVWWMDDGFEDEEKNVDPQPSRRRPAGL